MAAALQWRPPFYKRSVGEFYCFFMLPSLSPFHCFLCPSHSYCTFVKKPFFFFSWSLQGSASSCFEGVPTQHGPPAWGEWRHGWPQTVIKQIQMQSVTRYIRASVTPAQETCVKKVHRHRLYYRCHGTAVALNRSANERRIRGSNSSCNCPHV